MNKKNIIIISISLILGAAAIITGIKLYQLRQESIAPTEPKAISEECTLEFTVSALTPTPTATPSATPTGTLTPTATPTGTLTPTATPTGTLTPTATPTGTLTPTTTPTGTIAPTVTGTIAPTVTGTIAPTTTPTDALTSIPPTELPSAGSTLPTIGIIVGGTILGILGLLLAL